jgi:short-subunit dehydrogenase
MKDLTGKVVWITGASSGIGEALAYELARQGAILVLSARRVEALEGVRSRCERAAAHKVVPFDITYVDSHQAVVSSVLEQVGRIDMLINNAGVSQRSLVLDTALAVDRQIFETDYFGPIALLKAVLPHMLARKSGHIVAVSSLAGLVATPYRSAYSSAKAALLAFHDALRAETRKSGLKVSVVCPGFVATSIADSALVGDGTASAGRHPLPKSAMPAQVFAQKAVAALRLEQELIVVAGRERMLWWLSRVSPRAAALALSRVKVV